MYQDLLFKLYSILQLKLLLGQRKVVVLLSKAPESIIVVSHIIFFFVLGLHDFKSFVLQLESIYCLPLVYYTYVLVLKHV